MEVRKQLCVEAQVLNSHLLAIHLAEAVFVVLKAGERLIQKQVGFAWYEDGPAFAGLHILLGDNPVKLKTVFVSVANKQKVGSGWVIKGSKCCLEVSNQLLLLKFREVFPLLE